MNLVVWIYYRIQSEVRVCPSCVSNGVEALLGKRKRYMGYCKVCRQFWT